MRKQYLVQIKFKKDEGTDIWSNATLYTTNAKRYVNSLEEAKLLLAYVTKKFSKETERMNIIKTRIRVRQVTDWEEVK